MKRQDSSTIELTFQTTRSEPGNENYWQRVLNAGSPLQTTSEQKRRRYAPDACRIELPDRGITEIDLSPVSSLVRLEDLVLSGNRLRSLDLFPLSSRGSLRSLMLSDNKLTGLDLSPLSSCTGLRRLHLEKNQLTDIDLSPLNACASLEELYLSDNLLRNVKLCSCTGLRELGLWNNRLTTVDLSSLSSCDKLKRLDLGRNQLRQVDLSPLSRSIALTELLLNNNQLQSIDLAPLSSLTSLAHLLLNNNRIQNTDLSPLSSCQNLQVLRLDGNQLREVDLSPLSLCTFLRELGLKNNQLQTLDLTPLARCVDIRRIHASGNRLQSIDTTPLAFVECRLYTDWATKRVRWLDDSFVEPCAMMSEYVRPSSWRQVHDLVRQAPPDVRWSNAVLRALGLDHVGFIDSDLLPDLTLIPADSPLGEAREHAMTIALQAMARQIDMGGTTIGLRYEELKQHAEIASRESRILELRWAEIEQVKVPFRDLRADLVPLWLTAYGYEALRRAGMGAATGARGLERARNALRTMGFDLRITEDRQSRGPTRISRSLVSYILLSISYVADSL